MNKIPVEIELSSFCSLKCKSCINKDLENKYFIKDTDFYNLINFLYDNKENLLSIDLAGLGDAFSHPKITIFLLYIREKFYNTGLSINISQKGQCIKKEHLDIIQEMKDIGDFDINFYVGIFSVRDSVYKFLSGGDSFIRVISFVKELKKRGFNLSLELLNNYFSNQEYDKFNALCNNIGCSGYIKNITNYGGSINDYSKYLFGFNNKAESKEIIIFTEESGAGDIYLNSKCGNIPYFRADGYISMCSNLHGFTDKGIIGKISDIYKLGSLLDLYNLSQKNVFSEYCVNCSMNNNEINFYSKDYYIDNDGNIIREPALVKLYDINTADDLIFVYENDKEFVKELVINPEYIHKHKKIDFIQILDLYENIYDKDFEAFSDYMIKYWNFTEKFEIFKFEISETILDNSFGLNIIGNFCKNHNLEPIEVYMFVYKLGKISKEFYLGVLSKFMKYAVKTDNSILLSYMVLTKEKVINGKLDKNFGKEIVRKYFNLFN